MAVQHVLGLHRCRYDSPKGGRLRPLDNVTGFKSTMTVLLDGEKSNEGAHEPRRFCGQYSSPIQSPRSLSSVNSCLKLSSIMKIKIWVCYVAFTSFLFVGDVFGAGALTHASIGFRALQYFEIPGMLFKPSFNIHFKAIMLATIQ